MYQCIAKRTKHIGTMYENIAHRTMLKAFKLLYGGTARSKSTVFITHRVHKRRHLGASERNSVASYW